MKLPASLILAISAPVFAQPPTSGMLLWYDLATNSPGLTATDLSGNGNNGTVSVGTAPFIFNPKTITVSGFGGSMPTTTATIVAVVSCLQGVGQWNLFSVSNGTSAGRISLYGYSSTGLLFSYGDNASASNTSAHLSYGTFPDANWHVIVMTVSPGAMALWEDGTQVASSASSVTATPGGDLVIGNWVAGGQPFGGMLAHFAIYNRVLNSTEISAWGTYATSEPRNAALVPVPANHLAAVPPMGWGTWYFYGNNPTEANVHAQAAAMITTPGWTGTGTGLKSVGYTTIGLDGVKTSRAGSTAIQLNSTNFPSGGAAMGTYLHGLGLDYWFYGAPGTSDCQSQPGEWGYEYLDAQEFATWQVDYYKYDWCAADSAFGGYLAWSGWIQYIFQLMGQELQLSGRPILYSQSSLVFYHPGYPTWQRAAGLNLGRTSNDIWATWSEMMVNLESLSGEESYAGPGFFNDPDYLQCGLNGVTNPSGHTPVDITDIQCQAQMSMWAITASPLNLGFDMTSASTDTLATVSNLDAIAIDQDALGVQGKKISTATCGTSGTNVCEIWVKPLSGNSCAIALLNQDTAAHSMTATFSTIAATYPQCGSGPYTRTLNVWSSWPACSGSHCGASMGTLTTSYTTTVPATSAFLFTVTNSYNSPTASGGFVGAGFVP